MRSRQRKNLNKLRGVSFVGARHHKPTGCNSCPYVQEEFKYRNCLYVRCPFDKTKITLRDEPLDLPDVIQLRKEAMKPWERQQLPPSLTRKAEQPRPSRRRT